MATLYLMNSAKVQTFMISDATVDRAIGKLYLFYIICLEVIL